MKANELRNKRQLYYQVQVNTYTNPHGKTHSTWTDKIEHFHMNEERKAVALFKTKSHNDILLNVVQFFDDIPYAKTSWIRGQIEYGKNNVKIIRFQDKELGIDMTIPYSTPRKTKG